MLSPQWITTARLLPSTAAAYQSPAPRFPAGPAFPSGRTGSGRRDLQFRRRGTRRADDFRASPLVAETAADRGREAGFRRRPRRPRPSPGAGRAGRPAGLVRTAPPGSVRPTSTALGRSHVSGRHTRGRSGRRVQPSGPWIEVGPRQAPAAATDPRGACRAQRQAVDVSEGHGRVTARLVVPGRPGDQTHRAGRLHSAQSTDPSGVQLTDRHRSDHGSDRDRPCHAGSEHDRASLTSGLPAVTHHKGFRLVDGSTFPRRQLRGVKMSNYCTAPPGITSP